MMTKDMELYNVHRNVYLCNYEPMNLWKEKVTMCCSEHWSDPCAEHCRAACRCESHLPKIDFSFCPNSKMCEMCEMLRSVLVPSASTKSSTTAFMWTTCPMPIYQGLLVPITIMTILQYFQYFPARHFRRTTDFIQRAVETGGTVCVNCYMGLSRLVFHILVVQGNVSKTILFSIVAIRSATVVIAYLMMKQNMTCKQVVTFHNICR